MVVKKVGFNVVTCRVVWSESCLMTFCEIEILFKILNRKHHLEADNSNGRVMKKESGFSFFSSLFCLFVPQKMTSGRSFKHT